MKYLVQRGTVALPANPSAGLTVFRWGPPPVDFFGLCYSIDWSAPSPQVIFTQPNLIQTISLTRFSSDLYSFSHIEFGSIVLSKRSWFDEYIGVEGGRELLLSYQGWGQDHWYDGVYAVRNELGLTDLVLSGSRFQWVVGERNEVLIDGMGWMREHSQDARKQSLIEAVRQKYPFMGDGEVCPRIWNLETAANLLLLRLAFPECQFFIRTADVFWRRLAQNLNIKPLKEIDPVRKIQLIDIHWGSDSAIEEFMFWQIRRCPFIPTKLWERLTAKIE